MIQRRSAHETFIHLEMIHELNPDRMRPQRVRIADDHNSVLGSRDGDIQPSHIVQESQHAIRIRPNAREDNIVVFASLELVHARDFHLFHLLRLLHMPRQHLPQQRSLAVVRRDHADAVSGDAAVDKPLDDLLDAGGFHAVQEGSAGGSGIFRALHAPEHHGHVRAGPGEREVARALGGMHGVLERAVVEHVRREDRQRGVHSVLDVQAVRLDSQRQQALEQRDVELRALGFLVLDHRAQLLVIAHQNQPVAAVHDRDQTLRLARLRRLVDQHRGEAQPGEARVQSGAAGAADDLGVGENGVLGDGEVGLVERGLLLAELPVLLQLRVEFVELAGRPAHVHREVVQTDVLDLAADALAGAGDEADHAEAEAVEPKREVVDGDVGRRADEHALLVRFHDVVDDGGGDHYKGAKPKARDLFCRCQAGPG